MEKILAMLQYYHADGLVKIHCAYIHKPNFFVNLHHCIQSEELNFCDEFLTGEQPKMRTEKSFQVNPYEIAISQLAIQREENTSTTKRASENEVIMAVTLPRKTFEYLVFKLMGSMVGRISHMFNCHFPSILQFPMINWTKTTSSNFLCIILCHLFHLSNREISNIRSFIYK